jgi:acetyl-CoA carboxylase carboxyltransferase component
MSWQCELDALDARRAWTQRMGGEEKVANQHQQGKQSVRERIDQLLDAGSFREIGSISGWGQYDEKGELTSLNPTNQVIGWGHVDGRPVAVIGDDFTVRGGSSDASIAEKRIYPERLAHGMRMPLIRLVDGTGGGGSVKQIERMGYTYVPTVAGWEFVDRNLSQVPVVGLALGSVSGLGAARVAATHYSLMVRQTSQIFAAGPPVVAYVGQKVTKEELGGSALHARNGMVDDEVESESEAFARTRTFLSYLPRSIDELPERRPCDDPRDRQDESLLSAIPKSDRQVYAIRPIVRSIVDNGDFFEIGRQWGRSLVTGFARLDGWPVAVIASDSYIYGGAWSRQACEKVIRFLDLAETFRLPVVHLVDVPGFQIGLEAEKAATVRFGARVMSAITQSTVPWATVILRKCFGLAGAAHRPEGRYSLRVAWPSAQWGSLPVAGGLEAAYRRELESAIDPVETRRSIERRLESLSSPFLTAEKFGIEEIVDPRKTRSILCDFAHLCAPVRGARGERVRYRP